MPSYGDSFFFTIDIYLLELFVVLGTFPAAAVIIIFAALSYRQRHSLKMLSIIAGIIIVSIAGTLYIASFPEFLYYSEFICILFLWLGFFNFGLLKKR
ncbi:MAG: hypothetical protein QXI42_12560 [Thermoproteota archaeon]